jgi:hypothetical protein
LAEESSGGIRATFLLNFFDTLRSAGSPVASVNRRVVGSSPARGAKHSSLSLCLTAELRLLVLGWTRTPPRIEVQMNSGDRADRGGASVFQKALFKDVMAIRHEHVLALNTAPTRSTSAQSWNARGSSHSGRSHRSWNSGRPEHVDESRLANGNSRKYVAGAGPRPGPL